MPEYVAITHASAVVSRLDAMIEAMGRTARSRNQCPVQSRDPGGAGTERGRSWDSELRWRASLDEPRRLQFNHPDSVWSHWKRHTPIMPSRCADQRPRQWTGGGRSISFDQDMVRRAAIAIGENWSNDTFRLAAVGLRAAIRNETDLLALLPAAPATLQRSVEKAGAAVI